MLRISAVGHALAYLLLLNFKFIPTITVTDGDFMKISIANWIVYRLFDMSRGSNN